MWYDFAGLEIHAVGASGSTEALQAGWYRPGGGPGPCQAQRERRRRLSGAPRVAYRRFSEHIRVISRFFEIVCTVTLVYVRTSASHRQGS